MLIEALETKTQHKNNCFLVNTKFKLFSRQTSLHQNVKHVVVMLQFFVSSLFLKHVLRSNQNNDTYCLQV